MMGIHTLFLIYSALVIVIFTSIFALPTAYPGFLKCFTKNKEKSTSEANGESKSSDGPNGELNDNAESEDGNTSDEEENGDGDISDKGEDEALVATIQNIVAKLRFPAEATKHFDKLLVQVAKTMFLAQGLTSMATTDILRKHFCIQHQGCKYKLRHVQLTGQTPKFKLEKICLDHFGGTKSSCVDLEVVFVPATCQWLVVEDKSDLLLEETGTSLLQTLYQESRLGGDLRVSKVQFKHGKEEVKGVLVIPKVCPQLLTSVEVWTKSKQKSVPPPSTLLNSIDGFIETSVDKLSRVALVQCDPDLTNAIVEWIFSPKRILSVPKSIFDENFKQSKFTVNRSIP
jgi:hypothetical protein